MNTIHIERTIQKSEERQYFTIPFEVPDGIEKLDIRYDYPRHIITDDSGITYDEERNIIDLALTAGNGEYVGASGSDRTHITISSYESSQGYTAMPVVPGRWEIIVGAYKVAPEGVTVRYTIELTPKKLRLYKGDTHMHTNGSDGVLSAEELVDLCRRMGLEYVFITNHNNYEGNYRLPSPADMTVLPGTEWTHYNGHSGFLGIQRPYQNPFCVNTPEQAKAQIEEARAKGAMIVFNHPFCSPECGWKWGFDIAPFDAVEIWNGPLMMNNENEKCLNWWHEQLCEGKQIPITGGSDFHRPQPLSLPGVPCTCLYALSRSPEDILTALRKGHGYIKMSPDAPDLEVRAGDLILGDTAAQGTKVEAVFRGLRTGDVIRLISDRLVDERICPEKGRELTWVHSSQDSKFIRYEILRTIIPGMPLIRILVSNPIYFA